MTATPNFAPGARGGDAVEALAPAAGTGPFVLNLCSSTTPMALAQTDLPELKRFNFFVSRRFEEGRERFRLHMGYFATLAEAEEWLSVVREIYPGAWAGEAPGRKLRERATAEQAAQARHAAGPPPAPRGAPAPVAMPADPGPPESLAARVPVLKAAAPLAPAAAPAKPIVKDPAPARPPAAAKPVVAPKAAVAKPAAPKPAAPKPAAAHPATTTKAAAPKPAPSEPAARSAAPARPAPASAVAGPKAPEPVRMPARTSAAAVAQNLLDAAPAPVRGTLNAPKAAVAGGKTTQTRGVFADSNVREVLKALGDASATGETRLMRAPLPPPAAPPAPVAKEPAPQAPVAPAPDISDTQVLRLLETRRAEGSEAIDSSPVQEPAHGAIPMLKPDDTGTREALKSAVSSNAPVLFAVQLQWSVQPVELDKVPPLAIFSAYTLYTVEGSRDGRKWFGLRLGFFSDAISAKQVAHYVRSEFASVAVVPVSGQEKARATDQDRQATTVGAPASLRAAPADEFKLIDDEPAREELAKLAAKGPAPAAAAAKPAAVAPKPTAAPSLTDAQGRKIPGRPVPKVAVGRAVTQSQSPPQSPPQPPPQPPPPARPARAGAKVGAREKRGPQSLEETLEILGASQLSIDSGSGETLNDTGVRHLRVEVQKNSPFSKLLERLSERMKKP